MTEVSTAPSVVISSMMKKGMYDLLGAEERQCMRLVCHEFRQAVDALIDMLVLMLDSDICRFPAEAESMAKFHRSIPAATKLRICLVDDPFFDVVDAVYYLTKYLACISTTSSDQLPVKHCHIGLCGGRAAHYEHMARLREMMLMTMDSADINEDLCSVQPGRKQQRIHITTQVLSMLAGCTQLHSLVLDGGMAVHALCYDTEPGHHELFSSLARLTQLRQLSLGCGVAWSGLTSLSSLTLLECLCVQDLHGSAEQLLLPSLHTLRAWGMHGDASAPWQPCKEVSLELSELHMLPGLQHLEGVCLCYDADASQQMPAMVQRFASSAGRWSMWAKPSGIGGCGAGSLAALRNRTVMYSDASNLQWSVRGMASLLAAAPQLTSLCVAFWFEAPVSDLPRLLEPVEYAAHLHTLWLQVQGSQADTPAAMLAAATRYLRQRKGLDGDGKMRWPALRRICMSATVADATM